VDMFRPKAPKILNYLKRRGGSLKKIAKKMIPKVPTKRKVYTKASIGYCLFIRFAGLLS